MDGDPVIEVVEEDKEVVPDDTALSPVLESTRDVSEDTSETLAESSSLRSSRERSHTSSQDDGSASGSAEPSTGSSSSGPSGPPPGGPSAPYFPPAYRPASVRSGGGPGLSRQLSASQESLSLPMSGMDKTRAPGYYPAPATEDSEQALEVVSRAEGKRPMRPEVEDEEEEERIRHIATSDKVALERLRMGASAPPVTRAEQEDGDMDEQQGGPSAPVVELDQDGFETVDLEAAVGPSQPPTAATPVTSHPDLPAPPAQRTPRIDEIVEEVDELNLVPSAPPLDPILTQPSAPPPLAPSAPPQLDIEAASSPRRSSFASSHPASSPQSHVAELIPSAPSAPPLEVDEEENDGELESEPSQVSSEERPRVYLPRYEP